MAKTHRHQADFGSVARRRRHARRNRVRGDYDQRGNRGRVAEAEAIADAEAEYAYQMEILNTLSRGEL